MKTARTTRITVYGLLLIWCLVSAFPLFWMVSASLKPPSESFAGINAFIPQDPTFANYARVAQLVPMARNFVNSVIVAGVAAA